ncbi:MAG: hypothetical protein M3281_04095 [Chloroflexota bacterium]|nr:hypothetical protein [Chloroflexota bacterium]
MEELSKEETLGRLEYLSRRVADNQDRLVAASEDEAVDDLTADIGSDLAEIERLQAALGLREHPIG